MAKMYVKSSLRFENGYVLDADDNVIALPAGVAEQLNAMEDEIQKTAYLKAQPKAQPMPSLDGFERKSIVGHACISADTPTIDAEIKRSSNILNELRALDEVRSINKMLDKFDEAICFLRDDKFVEGDKVVMVDAPTIGNILTADAGDVIDMLIGEETEKL